MGGVRVPSQAARRATDGQGELGRDSHTPPVCRPQEINLVCEMATCPPELCLPYSSGASASKHMDSCATRGERGGIVNAIAIATAIELQV